MVVIGFSIGHDRGAVLIRDGKIVVGINDERLTRIKHDGAYSPNLPIASIDYCLEAANLTYSDVDLYVYNFTENAKGVPARFTKLTGVPASKLIFIPHHLSHAFSTFYSSGFDEAAVVVVDAMGSPTITGNPARKWYAGVKDKAEAWSIYKFTRTEYEEVYKKWVEYPLPDGDSEKETSIGGLYGIGTLQLVYSPRTNTWQAGKLMGLASYANQDWVDNHPRYCTEDSEGFPIIPAARMYPEVNYLSDFRTKCNVAGLYQREQEQLSMRIVEKAKELTGAANVCVAGGSFLNCNTNELIIKSKLFDKAYFLPSADDSGIPLGCAWYGAVYLEEQTPSTPLSPYFGRSYTETDILQAFGNFALNPSEFKLIRGEKTQIAKIAAELLAQEKVIGLFQGGSETGPRALGNRSILANPGCKWAVNYINSEIKGREWYRPFAPSALHQHVGRIFELDEYSPYMLVTTKVRPEWRKELPAITHIDDTARYQSVTPENNPFYYDLIKEFSNVTGLPVVLNTSFNGPEEPIVETPLDALNTFFNTGLFALILENYILIRNQ